MTRTVVTGLAGLAAVTSWAFAPAALAAPTGSAQCPSDTSGYVSWDTSAEPYQADNRVDKNGDGIVCAKPITDKTFVFDGTTYQLYNFRDAVLR